MSFFKGDVVWFRKTLEMRGRAVMSFGAAPSQVSHLVKPSPKSHLPSSKGRLDSKSVTSLFQCILGGALCLQYRFLTIER